MPLSVDSLAKIAPFNFTGRTVDAAGKTGLGSSAALVTSLVGALLANFSSIDIANTADVKLIETLAHICHCTAQGKIGSGFDISAAVHGSQTYRRFSKELLNLKAKPSELLDAEYVIIDLVGIRMSIYSPFLLDLSLYLAMCVQEVIQDRWYQV